MPVEGLPPTFRSRWAGGNQCAGRDPNRSLVRFQCEILLTLHWGGASIESEGHSRGGFVHGYPQRAAQRLFILVAAGLVAAGFSILAGAQGYTNTSWVIDALGGWSAGGTYSNLSAGGQPGAITVVSAGELVNQQGFLSTFFLRSELDTDGDGLPNEADSDNDADSLEDSDEITGIAFDPVTPTDLNEPDSDGDGVGDGGEAVAGTDPQDPGANLRIVDIQRSGGSVEVYYLARGGAVSGKVYRVRAAGEGTDLPGEVIATNFTPAGGVAPWYVVTNVFSDTLAPSNLLYGVEALQ